MSIDTTTSTTYTPAVGDRVIARDFPWLNEAESRAYEGMETTITEIVNYGDGSRVRYYCEAPSVAKPDDTVRLYFHSATPIEAAPAPVVTYTQEQYDEINLRLEEQTRLHNTWRSHAYEAVQIIGETLMQEAENRGWCSEYDGVVDEINSVLPAGLALPTREQDYTVDWTEVVVVRVPRSMTFTARSAEDALEMAQNEAAYNSASEYEIKEAVSMGAYESTEDDFDGAEVQEA